MIISVRAIDPCGLLDSKLDVCVTAVVEPTLLETLRLRLQPIRHLHVVVSTALSWGHGRELRYRAERIRVDRDVCRVEILCRERELDAVVNALHDVTVTDVGRAVQEMASSDADVSGTAELASDC